MSILQELEAAWARIDAPEKWTKGHYALNEKGELCDPSNAVCFCLVGAFLAPKGWMRPLGNAGKFFVGVNRISAYTDEENAIVRWNDDPARTWEDVRDAFAFAISEARRL